MSTNQIGGMMKIRNAIFIAGLLAGVYVATGAPNVLAETTDAQVKRLSAVFARTIDPIGHDQDVSDPRHIFATIKGLAIDRTANVVIVTAQIEYLRVFSDADPYGGAQTIQNVMYDGKFKVSLHDLQADKFDVADVDAKTTIMDGQAAVSEPALNAAIKDSYIAACKDCEANKKKAASVKPAITPKQAQAVEAKTDTWLKAFVAESMKPDR